MTYNGIIIINKPEGITSHTAVAIVKRRLKAEKAGHSGTLDPLATGVLPVMVGSAVKVSDWMVGHDKRYLAGIELGYETDSEDITGNIINRYEGTLPSFNELKECAQTFKGTIKQVPPMYSALKKDGKKLVDLARKGITIEREPREIQIFSIDAIEKDGKYYLDVHCSKGTYIRTLCADIGKKLGCGAVMSSLCRTKAGSFSITDSVTPEELSLMSDEEIKKHLKPTEDIFIGLNYKKMTFTPFFERLFKNGAPVFVNKAGITDVLEGDFLRIYDDNGFFAIGEAVKIDGLLSIKVKKFFISGCD